MTRPAQLESWRRFAGEVAARRASAPISPALRRDPAAAADFRSEAARFEGDVLARRAPADREWIRETAAQIRLATGTRSITLVPAFAREAGVARGLATALHGCDLRRHHLVLFVNAAAPSCSRADYEAGAGRIRAAVRRLAAAWPGLRLTLLERFLPRPILVTRLRGIVTDAVILAAAAARLEDPLLVYNDADQLWAPPGYLDRLVRLFARRRRLDLVTGPVLYGFEPGQDYGRASAPPAPELLLGARFIHAVERAAARGDGVKRHLRTSGANTAFRLASLIAAGGYDDALEDVQIGTSLAAMRCPRSNDVGSPPEHQAFDLRTAVATDPRRQVEAILAGCTASEAWDFRDYRDALGAEMRAREQMDAYARSPELLQAREVRAMRRDPAAREKVRARVLFNFLRPLTALNHRWLRSVSRSFGIGLRDPVIDGEGKLAGVSVDWGHSSVLRVLEETYRVTPRAG
ncbi:MAG TPA: hypothetical protein VGH20_14940 [Myxococcales bacterium]|jgi:hypothetical protein